MRQFYFVLITLIFSFFSLSANAQEVQKFALVISQIDYKNLAKLEDARGEGDVVASSLESSGFEVIRANNKTYQELNQTFTEFRRKVAKTPNAIVLIYYTGHGARDPNDEASDNYILGIDADIQEVSDLPIYGAKLSAIIESFSMVRAKAVIFVLDACRVSASFGKAASKGLAPMYTPDGILVAYSTSVGKVAEVGVYAPILAKELKNTNIDISTIFQNVKFAVSEKTGAKQLPWIDDKLSGRLCLSKCETGIKLSNEDFKESEKKLWEQASKCEDYFLYLQIYPEGKYKVYILENVRLKKCLEASKQDKLIAKPIGENELRLGNIAYEKKDYKNAKNNLKIACDFDYGVACSKLGSMYQLALGVEKSYIDSFLYYEKSCTLKDSFGCFKVGVSYEEGWGVTKDLNKAIIYLKRSCTMGSGHGCYVLAHNIEIGTFQQADIKLAYQYVDKACNLGFAMACSFSAKFRIEGKYIEKSYPVAVSFLEKGCSLGAGQACYSLAEAYEYGFGAPKSIEKAKQIYKKSCDFDYQSGCLKVK